MRKNNFDALRFYFAFVVLISHLIGISKAEILQKYVPYFNASTSVFAFFCISGFLITKSYLNSNSLGSYYIKRAARLLPAYILVIILSSLLLVFVSDYSIKSYFHSNHLYKYFVANLTFLNFIEPTLPGVFFRNGSESPVNGALWTLKVEIMFYLFLPLILFVINKMKRKYLLLVGIFLFSILYQFTILKLFQITGNVLYFKSQNQLPAFLSYFACGIALHYYFDLFLKNKNKFFILGIILLFLSKFIKLDFLSPIMLSCIIFPIAFGFKKLNKFAKYGDLSYGVYILHCPIINIAVQYNFFEKYNAYLVAFVVVILVLTLSFASWHLVEKHFLKRVHLNILTNKDVQKKT